jgi:hypothetical protein
MVEANVSEKRTVSIFRAEVTMLRIRGIIEGGRKESLKDHLPSYIIPLIPSIVTSAVKMETVRFSETLASTNQSTRRLNREHHHYEVGGDWARQKHSGQACTPLNKNWANAFRLKNYTKKTNKYKKAFLIYC